MNFVAMALFNVLKGMLFKMASQSFLQWLLFWVAEIIVKSTKTTKDDEFISKLKSLYGTDK